MFRSAILGYIFKRIIYTVVVLVGVSIIAFILVRLTPGDPARMLAGEFATDEEVAQMRTKMGLDLPIHVQYFTYMWGVLHGDLGESWYYKAPCRELIARRLPATAQLTGYGFILILTIAIPLGVIAGIKKGSVIDLFSMFLALIGQSMSPVWLCILMILVFGVALRWLPTQGNEGFKYAIMPAISLAFGFISLVSRMLRSGMVDVLREDYITATRARGIGRFQIYTKYAFKNALLPVVTALGTNIAVMMAGSMIIESIFGWPGLGQLTVAAVNNRDFMLVQSILLVSSFIFVVVYLLVDVLYSLIDKRITFN